MTLTFAGTSASVLESKYKHIDTKRVQLRWNQQDAGMSLLGFLLRRAPIEATQREPTRGQ